jgi:hypothetical protein
MTPRLWWRGCGENLQCWLLANRMERILLDGPVSPATEKHVRFNDLNIGRLACGYVAWNTSYLEVIPRGRGPRSSLMELPGSERAQSEVKRHA